MLLVRWVPVAGTAVKIEAEVLRPRIYGLGAEVHLLRVVLTPQQEKAIRQTMPRGPLLRHMDVGRFALAALEAVVGPIPVDEAAWYDACPSIDEG